MRALLQRVSRASVRVDDDEIARIGPGLLILLGVAASDPEDAAARLADRCAGLRIFEDDGGRMNRSVIPSPNVRSIHVPKSLAPFAPGASRSPTRHS